MQGKKVFIAPNRVTPSNPIIFNEKVCSKCNKCVEICPSDVFAPNPEKDKIPIVAFPDECWYCGCCVEMCPLRLKGAIRLVHPLMQKVRWKRKETGEHFRVGMVNPPPTYTRPPVSGWNPKVKKSWKT